MSDHAPAAITFYAIPDDQVGAVIDWLNDWEMGTDWDPFSDDMHESVTLGQPYTDPKASVSIALVGVASLVAAAPGAAWEMQADEAPECAAEFITHVPGWPLRSVRGDNDGGELFTALQIREAIANDTVAELLGDAYHREINRLREQGEGTVLADPRKDAEEAER